MEMVTDDKLLYSLMPRVDAVRYAKPKDLEAQVAEDLHKAVDEFASGLHLQEMVRPTPCRWKTSCPTHPSHRSPVLPDLGQPCPIGRDGEDDGIPAWPGAVQCAADQSRQAPATHCPVGTGGQDSLGVTRWNTTPLDGRSYWPADSADHVLEMTAGDALRLSASLRPTRTALVEVVPSGAKSLAGAHCTSRRWTYSDLL